MIIILPQADFSEKNLGKINVTRAINQFTNKAIAASGKAYTQSQKIAIDEFFDNLGAFDNSGIWNKLEKIYMPMLGLDVTKATLNYKTLEMDAEIDQSYYELSNKGITRKEGSPETAQFHKFKSKWNWSNKCAMLFITDTLKSKAIGIYGANLGTSANWKAMMLSNNNGDSIRACAKGTTVYLAGADNNSSSLSHGLIGASKTAGDPAVTYIHGVQVHQAITNNDATQYFTDEEHNIYPFAAALNGEMNVGQTPIGASLFGEGLSKEECKELAEAFESLWEALVY